ncbi:MAG: PAS domain S-box protein [Syntrophaceae bacterium]
MSISQGQYRRLIQSMTDYVFTVWVDKGRALETIHGPSCVTVTGYTADEYRENPYLWISMVHEDDREDVQRQVRQLLNGETTPPLEHRIWHKDGAVRWVRSILVPHYDEQGHLVSYDGLIRDITRRKQAEQALIEERDFSNAIIESLPGTFFLIDTGRRFIRWNKNQEIMMGYTADELHQMDALDTIYGEDRHLVDDMIRKVLEEGQAQVRARVVSKQGEVRQALLTAKRLDIQGQSYIIGTGVYGGRTPPRADMT